MRYMKFLALPALALAFSAANGLMAYDRDWDDRADMRYDRADLRHDYRDMRNDYARRDHLLADIEHDRWQMNEAIRCGRDRAAAGFARDLARDQRALDALDRDMRHDRRDMWRDNRDLDRDYRGYTYNWR
jgi:hypothetical protein